MHIHSPLPLPRFLAYSLFSLKRINQPTNNPGRLGWARREGGSEIPLAHGKLVGAALVPRVGDGAGDAQDKMPEASHTMCDTCVLVCGRKMRPLLSPLAWQADETRDVAYEAQDKKGRPL